ncbi:ABC transporter permease [Bifidobacterium aquikefiri]|uniref:ABC transporter permease n=1 Tax=Bifidobacterium aquikefiri TaxID=1653207 RepID=UPI0039E9B46B
MTDSNTTISENTNDFVVQPLHGQERFVAPIDETPVQEVDSVDESKVASSMWADAWRSMRKNPLFIVSGILILIILIVAIFPGIFTKVDPNYCNLPQSLDGPSSGHPLGFNQQGCDVYSRVVYGARTSVSVGILTTVIVTLFGGIVGALAGFYGGWLDAVLSRITDIFFAIPMLLGAIVVLQMFKTSTSIWKVVLVLALFGWVTTARIIRGSVLEAKNLEFNTASTALGSSPLRNLFRHVVPNALAQVIVLTTTSLGSYIVAEATLSFLGVGLPTTVVSWGGDISDAQSLLRIDPQVLFYPSLALAITVLAFIMMGDAVKDALDPKSRV